MNRKVALDMKSLLVGIVLPLLSLAALSQVLVPNRPVVQHLPLSNQVAHPRDWIIIEEGTPFLVPLGRILVITGLGQAEFDPSQASVVKLLFNNVVQTSANVPQACACQSGGSNDTPTIRPVSVGLSAGSGTSVSISSVLGTNLGRAWGYLVDA